MAKLVQDPHVFAAGGDPQKIAPLLAGIRDASLLGLRRLDLSGCGLETLPEEICSLRQLELLNLGGNRYGAGCCRGAAGGRRPCDG